MFADLHLHTNFSDGTFTPEELAREGEHVGLGAMALTDHDTVEGCQRMAIACEGLGIEFVPGVELTAEINETEWHALGYFIDVTHETFLRTISKFQAVRQERIHEMVSSLNQLGVPLRAETVFEIANCRSPGRPHVGRALIQEGFCKNMEEAFDRFLKKDRPAWVPKCKISAIDAIDLIHGAGGLAVMAHPGLNRTDKIIPELVEAGMDGIECFHSKHSRKDSERYLKIAAENNLLVTGGSDCHGLNKGRPLIGSVKLDEKYFRALKEKAAHRKSDIDDPEKPVPLLRS